jgi:hypothetical protein
MSEDRFWNVEVGMRKSEFWSIGQRTEGFEFGMRNAECGIKGQKTKDTHEGQRTEVREQMTENRNGELGMRNGEVGMLRLGILECGLNINKYAQHKLINPPDFREPP